MQPLLRKAATASIRPRPRRALVAARAKAHTLRPLSTQAPARARIVSVPPPWICRSCWQARSFSSTRSSLQIDAPAKTSEGDVKSAKTSEPLRVLFCGSDAFSCAALEALHREHVRDPARIESIDVVVRPGKRAGRGNKEVVHPPIRDLATSLGLPIHERDTFTGWDMPPQTNIIIAVSFGLFVPPRLLRAARFGGLNIHPSLLPDLRGPAPLHHALLAGRKYTGVTLQTLDSERFDHGKILARTPALEIPPDCDYKSLLTIVTPIAAELLVQGLREGVYVPPLEEVEDNEQAVIENQPLLHAPKITKADSQILPRHMPDLLRRFRALGPLWLWTRDRDGARKRVIFERISNVDRSLIPRETRRGRPSSPVELRLLVLEQVRSPDTGADAEEAEEESPQTEITRLAVWVPKDKYRDTAVYVGPHRIETVKVEGLEAKPAVRALKNFLLLDEK